MTLRLQYVFFRSILLTVPSLVQLLYTVVISLFRPVEATSYLFIQVNWYLSDTCFIAMNVTVLSRIAFLKNCQFAYIVLVSEQLTNKLTSAFIGESLTPSQSALLKRLMTVFFLLICLVLVFLRMTIIWSWSLVLMWGSSL